ncbi:VOC family protein [uncultured Mucilaginibacter sp.]|uniref:SMU1112c/YaeR family gloxylase I-like metalloprotein n=1 Tax=uncultured Mucilaginibacter sp. TaxID=797541 RepID=UPI00262948DD|nr:VOC family protein [uncultured Mucilaginibacter sp.]
MLKINQIHHIAIICSDYQISKQFYTNVLAFEVEREVFREARSSWKLDLKIAGKYQIELFSFPSPAPRPSRPEAAGLRHLAFEVNDLNEAILFLSAKNVQTEPIRVDEFTGKRFTFFADPDGLPLELYEV